ncbi:hypothetical protein GGD38_004745 [Chitinophagaceae bacterium OAS944]|nr:hypothetical protein [Chitinophagaceae bacterium OAS944]
MIILVKLFPRLQNNSLQKMGVFHVFVFGMVDPYQSLPEFFHHPHKNAKKTYAVTISDEVLEASSWE